MRADGKREGLRQAMAWLHTWSGLLLGWLLFVVFLMGALSLVREEITLWMHPEAHRSAPGPDMVGLALDHLRHQAPQASRWWIDLPGPRDSTLQVSWRAQERGPAARAVLDPATGQPLALRATQGGDFFYRLHFELYGLPRLWARGIVGAAALVMFVAMLCGIVLHKKIFVDFFTFRPGKGARSWMDGHAAAAVLALPFYLVTTFSGLLMVGPVIMPWANPALAGPVGGTDIRGREAVPAPAARRAAPGSDPAAGAASMREPVAAALAQAAQRWGQGGVERVIIASPGTARAQIELRRRGGEPVRPNDRALYDAVGQPLPLPGADRGVASDVYDSLQNLHRGRYAGGLLRNLLLACGLLGALMVASGQVLWVAKRVPAGQRPPGFGHRLVQVANVGILAGAPLALGAYFWLNRLLPAQLAGRAAWEVRGFFIAWGACLAWAALRPYRRAWAAPLALAAALFAGLPVLNPLTGGLALPDSLRQGVWALAAFDLYALAAAGLLGWTARRLWRRQAALPRTPDAAGTPLSPA